MSDAGNYGTGVPPELIQLLLPYLGGLNIPDANKVLGFQAKTTNNLQDVLKVLLSPDFGAFTGTYDPMLTVDQPAPYVPSTPMTDRYANSGNPAIQDVALGMKSGAYTALDAQTKLRAAIQSGALGGMTPEQTDAAVQEMWSEIVKNDQAATQAQQDALNAANKTPDNWYSQHGFPQPTEQYKAGWDQNGQFYNTAPMEGDVGKQLNDSAAQQSAASNYLSQVAAKNPDYRDAAGRLTATRDAATLADASKRATAQAGEKTFLTAPTTIQEVDALSKRLNFSKEHTKWMRTAWNMSQQFLDSTATPAQRQAEWTKYIERAPTGNATEPLKVVAKSYLAGRQNGVLPSQKEVAKAETAAAWSGRGAMYADRLAKQPVSDTTRKYEQQLAYSAFQQHDAQVRQKARADMAASRGHTPLSDVLAQRMAMLRAAGVL